MSIDYEQSEMGHLHFESVDNPIVYQGRARFHINHIGLRHTLTQLAVDRVNNRIGLGNWHDCSQVGIGVQAKLSKRFDRVEEIDFVN